MGQSTQIQAVNCTGRWGYSRCNPGRPAEAQLSRFKSVRDDDTEHLGESHFIQ
jgi:hypothetical protein